MNLVTKNTAIVQPGYRGEAVAEVIVDVDDDTKKITNMSTKLIDTKDYDPDPEVWDKVVDLDKRTQAWLDKPIAHLNKPARIENAMEGRIEEHHLLI